MDSTLETRCAALGDLPRIEQLEADSKGETFLPFPIKHRELRIERTDLGICTVFDCYSDAQTHDYYM